MAIDHKTINQNRLTYYYTNVPMPNVPMTNEQMTNERMTNELILFTVLSWTMAINHQLWTNKPMTTEPINQ